MKKIVPTYDTKIALAVANNVYRKFGYIRTTEAVHGERKSNKDRVSTVLATNPKYTKVDLKKADEQIEHYQSLLFLRLGDKGNDFQSKVLDVIASDKVHSTQIGILASLPHTYNSSIEREKRQKHEKQLAEKSSFVGEQRKRMIFDVAVDMVKPLPHKNLYIITFLDKNKNIIKTFSVDDPTNMGIVAGSNIQISCWVKGHQINQYTNGKETMVNRIKVLTKGGK
jgi:hypothetical protein